jgi:GNAT superfamily N-acetyltransferase
MQFQIGNNLENYRYLVLDELVVDNNYRGKGYGTKLLEYLENQAKELNVSGIGLLSGIKREKAHEFYIKNGFKFRSKWFAKKL